MSKRRVCLFIPHLGFGGAELQLCLLAKSLLSTRFSPHVVTMEGWDDVADELNDAGVPVTFIRRRTRLGLEVVGDLVRHVRATSTDLVHAFLFVANWRAALAGILNPDVPVVMSVRSMESGLGPHHLLLYRLLSPWTTFITGNANAVIANSAARTGIPPEKYRLLPNAVDTSRLLQSDFANPPEGLSKRPTVGFVARLEPRKDVALLSEVARRVIQAVPETLFLIVGDGESKNELVARTEAMGIADSFRHLGKQRNVGRCLRTIDVLINTSRVEGCNNAILEAMSMGIPVVATAVGGNPEIVSDGATGFVVDRGDVEGFARKVITLVRDDGLRATFGQEARRAIASRFDVSVMLRTATAIYDEALQCRCGRARDT